MVKDEFDTVKASLTEKIHSLETTLDGLNQAYNLHDNIRNDREQLVKDYQK